VKRGVCRIDKKGIAVLATILSLSILLFSAWTTFAYEGSEKFYGFPIPKYAKTIKIRDDFASYSRTGTSEEKKDGLPVS
jgi:energy-converting hydrogenase Eha subunit F